MAYQGSDQKPGLIYCRVPHFRDKDQTGVDGQERRCRQRASALGIAVSSRCVFVDVQRSAWKRDGNRPAWSALLTAVKSGAYGTLLLYRPGALLRYPWDVTELLDACEEHGVVLQGLGDHWNLEDPAQRYSLYEQAMQAGRFAELAARMARTAHESAAAAGRPHGGGRRAYGYQPGMGARVEAEAAIVQEIFARFLSGEALRAIAWDLNVRGVRNAGGGTWSAGGVARLIDAPRYAGLRVFRGQVARDDGGYQLGTWEACVSIDDWEKASAMRRVRAEAAAADRQANRDYPLTGLVVCANCESHMVGTVVGNYRMYACSSTNRLVADHCTRHIGADSLETFVQEEALAMLEAGDPDGFPALPVAVRLKSGTGHRAVTIRSVEALDGVGTGPDARRDWPDLTTGRKAAVVRFLVASIRIGAKTTSRGVFDDSRIEIVPVVAETIDAQTDEHITW